MSFQPLEVADDKEILVFHDILSQDGASSQAQLPVATLPVTNNLSPNSATRTQRSASPSEVSPLKAEHGQIGPKRPSVECCGFGIGAVILVSAASTLAFSLTIGLILSIRFGPPQIPPTGAVNSPSSECSQIGLTLLRDKKGAAADAAIAMALCAGVVRAESSGLGGDGFAIYHDHRRSDQAVYDGRSCSPKFLKPLLDALENPPTQSPPTSTQPPENNTSNSSSTQSPVVTTTPSISRWDFSPYRLTGWAVTTPTELALFKNLHKRRGKLGWEELFTPVIELARKGFKLLPETVAILKSLNLSELAEKSPRLAEIYLVKSGNFISVKPVGSVIQRPDLADLLERIAKHPLKSQYFYEGDPARNMSKAIIERSPGNQDLFQSGKNTNFTSNCTANIKESNPLSSLFKDYTLMYPSLPSSAIAVAEILGILSETNFTKMQLTKDSADVHQIIAEATKYAFADLFHFSGSNESAEYLTNTSHWSRIASQINLFNVPKSWSDYVLRNPGHVAPVPLPRCETTGNFVSALDEHEGFVALTLSLGSPFGSMITTQDGVVLNNHMEAFYYEPIVSAHPNWIGSEKKPWSVQSPIIAHVPQSCNVRTAVGAIPFTQAQFSGNQTFLGSIASSWHVIPSVAEVLARLLGAGRESATRSLSRWRYSPLPLTGNTNVLIIEGNLTNLTDFDAPLASSINAMRARGYSISVAESPLSIAGIVSKVSDHIDDKSDPRSPSSVAIHFGTS